MSKNNIEGPGSLHDPLSYEHFQPTDLQVAVGAFKKLKSKSGI